MCESSDIVYCCLTDDTNFSCNIPAELVLEYFEQEHFSLKRLLARYSTRSSLIHNLTVVHTRSDQFIHGIPCLPADRLVSSDSSEAMDAILKLVHDNPHILVVEHLARLRSDGAVRGAVQSWARHDTRNVFLMVVDMSNDGALDRGQ
jgi:hypothetical protein